MIAFWLANTNRITIINLLWEDVGLPALCFFVYEQLLNVSVHASNFSCHICLKPSYLQQKVTKKKKKKPECCFLCFLSLPVFFSSTLPRFPSTRRKKKKRTTKSFIQWQFSKNCLSDHREPSTLFLRHSDHSLILCKRSCAHHNWLALWAVSVDRWEPRGGRARR